MVDLGARSYTVQIGPGLLDTAGPACARLRLGRRAAVVTQAAIASHATRVTNSLRGAGFDPEARLTDINFQYGTSLTEPNLLVPTPGSLVLFAGGTLLALRRRRAD